MQPGPGHRAGSGKGARDGIADCPNYAPIVVITFGSMSLLALSFPFMFIPALKRYGNIPWMATPRHVIEDTFSQLRKINKINSTSSSSPFSNRYIGNFVDLGSGDGRIVIAAAKNRFYGIGYELNPVLITLSYYNSILANTFTDVSFKNSDFWDSDLDDVDVISCFGVNSVMDRLFANIIDARNNSSRKDKTFTVMLFRFQFKHEQAKNYLVYAKDELYIYHVTQGGSL